MLELCRHQTLTLRTIAGLDWNSTSEIFNQEMPATFASVVGLGVEGTVGVGVDSLFCYPGIPLSWTVFSTRCLWIRFL